MSGESSDILLLVLVTREEIPVPDEDAPTTHIFNSLLRSLSSNETDASESTTEENPTEAQHYPDQNEMVRQRTHWGGLISEKLRTAPNWTTQNGSGTRTEMHQYIEFEANDTVCVLYTTSRSFCSSEKVLQAKALFLWMPSGIWCYSFTLDLPRVLVWFSVFSTKCSDIQQFNQLQHE